MSKKRYDKEYKVQAVKLINDKSFKRVASINKHNENIRDYKNK